MEKTSTDEALSGLGCATCGVGRAELAALLRHIEHLSSALTADDQRRLRAHLFALLAGAETIDLTDGVANEYPLLKTADVEAGSLRS